MLRLPHLVTPGPYHTPQPLQEPLLTQQGVISSRENAMVKAQRPLCPLPRHPCVPRRDAAHHVCLGQDTEAFLNLRMQKCHL